MDIPSFRPLAGIKKIPIIFYDVEVFPFPSPRGDKENRDCVELDAYHQMFPSPRGDKENPERKFYGEPAVYVFPSPRGDKENRHVCLRMLRR